MDYGRSEIARLKSLRFARSYKEAHGHHLEIKDEINKFPFIVFSVLLLAQLAAYY